MLFRSAEFSEILLILLSEGGQVNDGTWKVHVLHLADLATVLADNHDSVLLDLSDFASERAVSNVDNGSNLDGVGESSVGAGDASVVTFDGVVGDNLQVLSGNELNVLAVDEFTSADLGSLGVEHDSAGLVGALLESLSQVSDGSSVRDVISVGEIETSDIHAGVEHLHEHLDIPAGGSEGANDLGLALVEINSLKDVLESDATDRKSVV